MFIEGVVFSDWIYRALTFLVISCPCALVISMPLGFFDGIGGASKRGILIKGGNFLEALNHVETVVFDKTGTLTKGVFRVTDIKSVSNITDEELHKYTATAESLSNHPIVTSIVNSYKGIIKKGSIENYEEIVGYGVKVIVDGKEILCGNSKLMKKANINFVEEEAIDTIIYTAINVFFSGSIKVSDEIKEDSKKAIDALKTIGVKETIMLTGDSENIAEKVAKVLGVDKVYSELLPAEKVELLESVNNVKGSDGKIIFVGDGRNDAPVLARADIGIAMGGLGSDAAIEAADVVIMTDEPYKIFEAIKIGKRTRRIVLENIIFALGIKLFVLILGAFGDATMWQAVLVDVGVAILAISNAMRALRIKNI